MSREEMLDELDKQPPEEWLVAPERQIQADERLTPEEWQLLREIVGRRKPDLLPQLGIIGVRVQRPSERERVRDLLVDEFCEVGLAEDLEPNEYGILVDDLIRRLGNI